MYPAFRKLFPCVAHSLHNSHVVSPAMRTRGSYSAKCETTAADAGSSVDSTTFAAGGTVRGGAGGILTMDDGEPLGAATPLPASGDGRTSGVEARGMVLGGVDAAGGAGGRGSGAGRRRLRMRGGDGMGWVIDDGWRVGEAGLGRRRFAGGRSVGGWRGVDAGGVGVLPGFDAVGGGG